MMETFIFSIIHTVLKFYKRQILLRVSQEKKTPSKKREREREREKLDQLDQIADLHSRITESAGLGEGFRVCIPNEFPSAAVSAGPETTL